MKVFSIPGPKHIPLVFLIDTSCSMVGKPISAVNERVQSFKVRCQQIQDYFNFRKPSFQVVFDVCLIYFNAESYTLSYFGQIDSLDIRPIQISGTSTVIGTIDAINFGFDILDDIKLRYRAASIDYSGARLLVFTSGDIGIKECLTSDIKHIADRDSSRYIVGYDFGSYPAPYKCHKLSSDDDFDELFQAITNDINECWFDVNPFIDDDDGKIPGSFPDEIKLIF